MLALLVLYLVAAAGLAAFGRRVGRATFAVAAVPHAATLGWALWHAPSIVDGSRLTEVYRWIPDLDASVSLRLDGLALLMVLLISGVGLAVLAYCSWYFAERPDPGRVAVPLTVFGGSMLLLVLADNVFLLFVGWELTSVTSFLLIGLDDKRAAARASALQALLTTALGGMALLGGLVLLAHEAGTASLSAMLRDLPSGPVASAGLALVLLGAATKSAQVPFHAWLPGAMTAPSPISAYLHSATMVKAGVYLLARFSTPAAVVAPWWRPAVVALGLTTLLVGGYRALRQYDLKLLLAYSTVSQLGLLVAAYGISDPATTLAATALLLGHALFKAALFFVVGIVDHTAHSRDVRRLSGLGRRLPGLAATATLAAASLAGLPPLLGFVAKEKLLEGILHLHWGAGTALAAAVVVAGSAMTFGYAARFVWGAFAAKDPEPGAEPPVDLAHMSRPPLLAVGSPAALAGASLLAGMALVTVRSLLRAAAGAADPAAAVKPVVLWAGFGGALYLSAVTVAAGALLFARREIVSRVQDRVRIRASAQAGYEAVLRTVLSGSTAVTGRIQTGSLPVYLGIIFITLIAAPAAVLLARWQWHGSGLVAADGPLQVAAAAFALVGAVGAVRAQHRMVAVVLLGAVGYAVAALFALQGGPDLALTQLLVETLLVVALVLVLRRMPSTFSPRRVYLRRWRGVVSIGVGVFTFGALVVSGTARTDAPVSLEHTARAQAEAGSRNVVNTILVDFRGIDTFGEIAVVATAALGAVGLLAFRSGSRPGSARVPGGSRRLSPLLQVLVRTVFHTLLVVSLYFLVAGHDAPGGGFVAGLVAGCALVLLSFSDDRASAAVRRLAAPWVLVGAGLAVAAIIGVVGLLAGGAFLEAVSVSRSLPFFGTVKLRSSLGFDVGVYLVVLGAVAAILRAFSRADSEAGAGA